MNEYDDQLIPRTALFSSRLSNMDLPKDTGSRLDAAAVGAGAERASEALSYRRELRLLLEEMCCNLFRFRHVSEGHAPESIRIRQEFSLGRPGAFADIRVETPERAPFFVEVKHGYSVQQVVQHLERKYADPEAELAGADRLLLLVNDRCPEAERRLRASIGARMELDVWDEPRLLEEMGEHFDLGTAALEPARMAEVCAVLDRTLGAYAFGEKWNASPLQATLLWHFGPWKLRGLCESFGLESTDFLAPGMYNECVVLMADICSFCSYVRDTRSNALVRDSLAAFYSKARYEIHNSGGMLYQFVGDEVIGLFGIPQRGSGDFAAALECARALTEVGCSISNKWQRHIDRVQQAQGVHIALAVGDMQVVSLKPFDLAYVSAISDSINMASRLLGQAGQSEILVSNSFYLGLPETDQAMFNRIDPVDGRLLGSIHAWKMKA